MLPFFVYGTLRPGEHNHGLFLRGRTRSEEPAAMRGLTLYDGPGYPYAVETPGEAAVVRGELITARPEAYEALLRSLDHLEEYTPGAPTNLYERVRRAAVLTRGTSVQAWVYVAAPTVAARLRARGTPIESGDWSGEGRVGAR
ncbi:gamma-glutamylcyclotransferase family protein [Streptomyces heilongjiangensis]|uniref:Gamma-glutamylcyclotransferase family protein n=1 Tax=Streptomyces heilongjiangensis TaxID=945052 RepID=A0ABW1BBS6_9ACTN|nr:gamma-glutamylcyclotransferase family protein [Streptomyces heilongjiangensis]MDC2950610.1 gamma-glutamylcyclotransferase [Streptomyces heilongjiangensis]